MPAEIATHTVGHVANPNVSQIVGARDWLNKVGHPCCRPRRRLLLLFMRTPPPRHTRAPHTCVPHSTVCGTLPALQTAGIPKEKIQGFRAPFLIFSPEQREILNENGELAPAGADVAPTELVHGRGGGGGPGLPACPG